MTRKQRTVGPAIYRYMMDKGQKQNKIAEKAGVPLNTFNDMLLGKRNINAEEYFDICEALEVPIEKFLPSKEGGAA